MSFSPRDHCDQASAALTNHERELIIDYLEEGNSKHDLAEMVMEFMSATELQEILDHIDNVAMEEEALRVEREDEG